MQPVSVFTGIKSEFYRGGSNEKISRFTAVSARRGARIFCSRHANNVFGIGNTKYSNPLMRIADMPLIFYRIHAFLHDPIFLF